MSSIIREKSTASVKSLLASAIREATFAANDLRTRPKKYKSIYKYAGSKDNFLGREMMMDEVEPALLRSSKNMRSIIRTLKILSKRLP